MGKTKKEKEFDKEVRIKNKKRNNRTKTREMLSRLAKGLVDPEDIDEDYWGLLMTKKDFLEKIQSGGHEILGITKEEIIKKLSQYPDDYFVRRIRGNYYI